MKKHKNILVFIGVAVFFMIFLSPIVIVLSGSLRELGDNTSYLNLFQNISLESYRKAFSEMAYFRSLGNSIKITVISVLGLLLLSSSAGYAIARLGGKLSGFVQMFFLSGMIISAQMSIIPMFKVVKFLGLNNTIVAPICLYITSALPFSIFLYTNFIKSSVPYALEEAATVDGASTLRIFTTIVIPLTKPALTSIVITQGVPIWNDFFFGMLFLTSPEKKTLPLTMLGFIGDMENATQWNMLFAACILSAIPILLVYVFLQKYFMTGLTVGAVKG